MGDAARIGVFDDRHRRPIGVKIGGELERPSNPFLLMEEVPVSLEQARAREIVTVLPWTEKREDGVWLRIPEAAGYRVSEEKMSAPAGK